jgi:hypothetical protein
MTTLTHVSREDAVDFIKENLDYEIRQGYLMVAEYDDVVYMVQQAIQHGIDQKKEG